MCYVAHVFSSLPVCKWFFGRPTVRQGTLECGDEIPVFQPLEVKCSPSSAAQPGDVSCESAHCLFCKTWHNYGSAEKQGQEKGGIYYSSHVVSFELVANGFCVVLFSRVLSSFNFSASLLALSILFTLLNYAYNFAFPKVTKILVLGSFNLKRRIFDPPCKTWFSCFMSPLCNLPVDSR